MKKNVPELLLPAGKRESFYAALKAGADAIYLGLNNFNARQRATNFSIHNLSAILHEARQRNVKIYITVNTLVKNKELPGLIQLLNVLDKYRVDAVIIQDWGVYHIAKRYFPALRIHASTQMGVHNSIGVAFCEKMGFDRVILARELTMPELKKIVSESNIGIEVFVHGALCYSFSGECLFSSFLSGNSANRGLCIQPCRRNYSQNEESGAFFSLKDNQQIERIKELAEMKVASLKVEGRLKPPDYVYRVGMSYRHILDGDVSVQEAETALKMDFGREKSGYFLGGNVSKAITKYATAGLLIGYVEQSDQTGFFINPDHPIQMRNRLLVKNAELQQQEIIKVENFRQENDMFWVQTPFPVERNSPVFLSSENIMNFPNRFPNIKPLQIARISYSRIEKIVNGLIPWQNRKNPEQYFVRIANPEWLKNLYMEDYAGIILNFDKVNLSDFSMKALALKKNAHRFWLELPPFISEKDLDFYATQCNIFCKMGIRQFMLSHPSQVLILPKNVHFAVNETCYVLNDAAAAFFMRQRAQFWIYPLENEMKNMVSGSDRNGIVNMYFHPKLFFSRMPVKISGDNPFFDELEKKYHKKTRDGMTVVIPDKAVCLFYFKKQLRNSGFYRFMIDLTYENPDRQLLKLLMAQLKLSKAIPGTTEFNFKNGLR